jgi:4-amino-4-deoxy-L-arabinose transferase-like glycosyltransferase
VRPRQAILVAGLTLLAALLRFPTLDVQSFWLDEAVTVDVLRGSLGHVLSGVVDSESTPPLYYVLAWLWSQFSGLGEAGLRSFSALLGTATIPVVWGAGRRLAGAGTGSPAGDRAGAIAALLAAVNPLLIWYSQEARAYALLVFLAALSFLLFLRALDEPTRGRLVAWGCVGALALATHYFAFFLLLAELLVYARARGLRASLPAVAPMVLAGIALAPLLLHQAKAERAGFISGQPFGTRVLQVPKQLLIGYSSPAQVATGVVSTLLFLAGVWLVVRRGDERERSRAALAAIVAGIAIAVPLVLAAVGLDYLITRNLITAAVPLLLVAAIGFGSRRAGRLGPAACAALALVSLGVYAAQETNRAYQRDNWRGAIQALGHDGGPRLVVLSSPAARSAARVYLSRPARRPAGGVSVREIDIVAISLRRPGEPLEAPAPVVLPPAPGFRLVRVEQRRTFAVTRYRSDAPQPIDLGTLLGLTNGDLSRAIVVER